MPLFSFFDNHPVIEQGSQDRTPPLLAQADERIGRKVRVISYAVKRWGLAGSPPFGIL